MSREIHPELLPAVKYLPAVNFNGPVGIKLFRALRSVIAPPQRIPEDVQVKRIDVPTMGKKAWLAQPKRSSDKPRPCLIWIHGGGHIISSQPSTKNKIAAFASNLDAVVINPDYRLSPEDAFPADLDDNYGVMVWAKENASSLNIDTEKIMVGGDSAGGGLAAAVAQKAKDQGFPLFYQILNYPMLDDRTCVRKDLDLRGIRVWSLESNIYAWKCYLGQDAGGDSTPEYAVPGRRQDLSGLAPCWIGCGTLDLFYDEDKDYYQRLKAAGVPVTWDELPGAYHGFDMLLPEGSLSMGWHSSMVNAVLKALREARKS